MKVFKFGGASVKDAESFKNVLNVLSAYSEEDIFVVISAMGKMTNAFEKLHEAYFEKRNFDTEFAYIYDYHFAIIAQLFKDQNHSIYNDLSELFDTLKTKLSIAPGKNFNFEYDQIVSYGELISSCILSHYLNENAYKNKLIDARHIIKTDTVYREARIDWELTPKLIKECFHDLQKEGYHMGITQGFIGSSSHGYTTTLGREGSDFTAAILGYSLNAEDVTIWKDVPGVLNADPKQFTETEKIDFLSYLDAIELAYYGATVIHPKTIKPLENTNIPLKVKSFINPTESGTSISSICPLKKKKPCYIFKFNQILISIFPRDFSFIAEHNISKIFKLLAKSNVKVNMMQNSAVSFSICTDYDKFKTPKLIDDLKKTFKIYYNKNLELVTIRHYNNETIKKITKGKEVMLEQRSRNTFQVILKST